MLSLETQAPEALGYTSHQHLKRMPDTEYLSQRSSQGQRTHRTSQSVTLSKIMVELTTMTLMMMMMIRMSH